MGIKVVPNDGYLPFLPMGSDEDGLFCQFCGKTAVFGVSCSCITEPFTEFTQEDCL